MTLPFPTVIRPGFSQGHAGLLPAIAQDFQSGCVLWMAWMNNAAFEETLVTGSTVYYCRSPGSLWRKGERSGHRQKVHAVGLECDEGAILILVEQTVAACHEGL